MGAQGSVLVDFGAFPGASDASATVTGQAAILAGSLVEAWILPVATADHTADEHLVETLSVFAGNVVAGVGFTVYLFNNSQLAEPLLPVGGNNNKNLAGGLVSAQGLQQQTAGGMGTRIYGKWTVAWVWN